MDSNRVVSSIDLILHSLPYMEKLVKDLRTSLTQFCKGRLRTRQSANQRKRQGKSASGQALTNNQIATLSNYITSLNITKQYKTNVTS